MQRVPKLVQSRIEKLRRSGWFLKKVEMRRGVYVLELENQEHYPLMSYIEVALVWVNSRGKILSSRSETGEIYTINECLE